MNSVSSSHFEIVFPLFPLSLLPSDRLYPPSSRNHLPQSSFYHLQIVRRICYTLPLPRPFENPLANYLVESDSTARSAQKGSTSRRISQGIGLSRACGRSLLSHGDVERMGKWVVELLRACPNLQSVHSEIRYQGSTMLASETLGSLSKLLHLTLSDDRDFDDNLASAQRFVREFRPAQGYLESLTITHFNDYSETRMSSSLPTPSFNVKHLSFIDNDEGPAWSSYFLPSMALDLVSLRFEEDGWMDIDSQDDLSTLLVRASGTLETLVIGENRNFGDVVGTVNSYGSADQEDHVVFTVFPLDVFPIVTFRRMRNLALRGLYRLALYEFANIARSCPHLVKLELTNSTWVVDEWTIPQTAFSFIIETISPLSSLRLLDLGHLPLLAESPSLDPIVRICLQRQVELYVDFCKGDYDFPRYLRDVDELAKDHQSRRFVSSPDYGSSSYPDYYETAFDSKKDEQASDSSDSMYASSPFPSHLFDLYPFPLRYPSSSERSLSPSLSSSEPESSFLPAPPHVPRLEPGYELEDYFDDVEKEEDWEEWSEKVDVENADRKWREGGMMEWEVREVEGADDDSEEETE